MKKVLVIFMFFIALFTSCNKISDKEPCTLKDIEVTTNSPVIVGWPIYLSTRSSQTESFNWAGPKGIINTQGAQNSIQVLNAAFSDSGVYKVELTNTFGCLEYTRSTFIKVIPAPPAPCTVTNNTSTSSVVGLGDNTYSYVSFTNNKADAYPTVGSSNQGLHFRFFGNLIPKPGIYKTTQSINIIDNENQVGCWINTFPLNEFINKERQDVYVNKINGKLQISFCNADFTNPVGSSAIRISAKITEP
jgi:hypothetical protein